MTQKSSGGFKSAGPGAAGFPRGCQRPQFCRSAGLIFACTEWGHAESKCHCLRKASSLLVVRDSSRLWYGTALTEVCSCLVACCCVIMFAWYTSLGSDFAKGATLGGACCWNVRFGMCLRVLHSA